MNLNSRQHLYVCAPEGRLHKRRLNLSDRSFRVTHYVIFNAIL